MRWPTGIRSAATSAGIKGDGALDLGLIAADESCTWAGTFTKNAAAAAPVLWCKERLSNPARAIIVNSGNANACTGAAGIEAVEREAAAVADRLGCHVDEVLVAATGPIGVPLPVERIVSSVPDVVQGLDAGLVTFASSILTTDTTIKTATVGAGNATVVGVAKGAAMLAPNMATMLAFLATDADVDAATLQKLLDVAVDRSFNRITIDACESTNDSVFMLATGASGETDVERLLTATSDVCSQLAHAMVSDAEGGSRVARITVQGAATEKAACDLARAVASSALWKAAVYGSDPNWGRIASALGASDRTLDLGLMTIEIGGATVFAGGEPEVDLTAARDAMGAPEFEVRCVVGRGPGEAQVLTADLSPEYVTLNAWGTT